MKSAKKKELVGNFKNGGREWQPKGTPEAVRVHDFPADSCGKAIPYGVYDPGPTEPLELKSLGIRDYARHCETDVGQTPVFIGAHAPGGLDTSSA